MNLNIEGVNTFLRSYKKVIGILLPLPFVILYLLTSYSPSLYIITPKPELRTGFYSFKSFNDTKDSGQSEIQLLDTSTQHLSFKYTLKEGCLNPYTNIRIQKRDSSFFDLSNYQLIHIRIKALKGLRIPFYLASYEKNHTQPEESISFRYSLNNLNVSHEYTDITLPFDELHTPDWWYISNHKTERDFRDPDYSKVQHLYIANCINIAKNQEDLVEIEEISFHVNMLKAYALSGLFLLVYYIGFAFLLRKKEPVEKKEINFQYEKVSSRNHQDTEEETVLEYLKTNYAQQDLTIIDVQTATGIHERKISSLIKKKIQLNFKQYLNGLRITEAKKMLSETKLPISDIAFQVGYANASHFNRVFKSFENCSPNDYRKEHSKTSTKGE